MRTALSVNIADHLLSGVAAAFGNVFHNIPAPWAQNRLVFPHDIRREEERCERTQPFFFHEKPLARSEGVVEHRLSRPPHLGVFIHLSHGGLLNEQRVRGVIAHRRSQSRKLPPHNLPADAGEEAAAEDEDDRQAVGDDEVQEESDFREGPGLRRDETGDHVDQRCQVAGPRLRFGMLPRLYRGRQERESVGEDGEHDGNVRLVRYPPEHECRDRERAARPIEDAELPIRARIHERCEEYKEWSESGHEDRQERPRGTAREAGGGRDQGAGSPDEVRHPIRLGVTAQGVLDVHARAEDVEHRADEYDVLEHVCAILHLARAVLERFHHVSGLYSFASSEIGHRAGELDGAVVAARREL